MTLNSFKIAERKCEVTAWDVCSKLIHSSESLDIRFQMIFSETFGLNANCIPKRKRIQRIVFKVQMLAFIVILITGIRLHRFPAKNFYHLQWNSSARNELFPKIKF